MTVFPNPGNGQFVQASGVFTQSSGSANGLNLVAGDFNNDGKIDLATSPNYVSAWLRQGPPRPELHGLGGLAGADQRLSEHDPLRRADQLLDERGERL